MLSRKRLERKMMKAAKTLGIAGSVPKRILFHFSRWIVRHSLMVIPVRRLKMILRLLALLKPHSWEIAAIVSSDESSFFLTEETRASSMARWMDIRSNSLNLR